MNQPKRHHWWPQLQSERWRDAEGGVHVTSKQGEVRKLTPINIGVEGHLYSSFELTGDRNPAVESWLSKHVDGPFDEAFDRIFDFSNTRRQKADPWPEKEKVLKEIGFIVDGYVDFLVVSEADRAALARYIAALVVRNPGYLKNLAKHYEMQLLGLDQRTLKNLSLKNMLSVFDIYLEALDSATFGVLRAEADHEFLFPDSGPRASEPWRAGPIPFDLHVPLTPRIAVEVLPVVGEHRPVDLHVGRLNNRGVARFNRMSLQDAQRYVFSRQTPPLEFIMKYMGKPAPMDTAVRVVEGQIRADYFPQRPN